MYYREVLNSVEKKLEMRRNTMITEAGCLFPIMEVTSYLFLCIRKLLYYMLVQIFVSNLNVFSLKLLAHSERNESERTKLSDYMWC